MRVNKLNGEITHKKPERKKKQYLRKSIGIHIVS